MPWLWKFIDLVQTLCKLTLSTKAKVVRFEKWTFNVRVQGRTVDRWCAPATKG